MVDGKVSNERILGELTEGMRNVNRRLDDMQESIDDLKRAKWMGKGVLITLSSAGGVAMAKLPAILTALGK